MANGKIAITDKHRAETLMDYFKRVYRSSRGDEARNPLADNMGSKLQMLLASEEKVRTELKILGKHKVVDPDEIHPAIVQSLSEVILVPVIDLFASKLDLNMINSGTYN
ncbi:unnamed protein product [Echinostoma caproni]|uniref:MitMem_reg domain-containing protein n=1 Tax=Echinostoma caproni TaxID=27848 RepID=A0A183A3L4_9TREM|nr:unnamed protein product [Echinostoma caproni]